MADYRTIDLATETVEWTSEMSRKVFRVVVLLRQEETAYFCDGNFSPVRNGLTVDYKATVDGKEVTASGGVVKLTNTQGAITHRLGKIGLSNDQATRIAKAVSVVKTHPAWIEKLESEKKSLIESLEHEKHVRRVESMMTLNGMSK